MSDYIDLCNETYLGIKTLLYNLIYTDGDNWYINMLDGGVTESDVSPITDCTDYRGLESLFRLSIVEDINGNPAIQTVPISEGSLCISSCEAISPKTLLYQCFYQDASGNIYLGVKQGFDSEVANIISNFTGTYSTQQLNALNDFIVGTKALFGISLLNERFDTFYILAAANTHDADLNLANLAAHTLVEVNNPVFTAFRGYNSDGLSSYLDAQYNPTTDAVNISLNDASYIMYSRTDTNTAVYDLGARGVGGDLAMRARVAGSASTRLHDVAFGAGLLNAASTGMLSINRCINTSRDVYRNNTNLGNEAILSSGLPNQDVFLMCYNATGVPAGFSDRQYPFYAFASCITFNEHKAFYALLETYLTVLGAQA